MWWEARTILLNPSASRQDENDGFCYWYVDQRGSVEMGLRVELPQGQSEEVSRAFQKTWMDLLLHVQVELEFFDAPPLEVSGKRRQSQPHGYGAVIKEFSPCGPPADAEVSLTDDDLGRASPSAVPIPSWASQAPQLVLSGEELLVGDAESNGPAGYVPESTAAPRFRRFASIRNVRALGGSDEGSGNDVTDGTVEATIVVRLDVAMISSLVGAPLDIRLVLTVPVGWAAGGVLPYPVHLQAPASVGQFSATAQGNASSEAGGYAGGILWNTWSVPQLRPHMSVLDESIALLGICGDSGDNGGGSGYQPSPTQANHVPSDVIAAATIIDRKSPSTAAVATTAMTVTTATTATTQGRGGEEEEEQQQDTHFSGSAACGTHDDQSRWARPPEARRQEIFHAAVWLLRSSPEEERAAVAAVPVSGNCGDRPSFSFLAVHHNGLPVAAAAAAGHGGSKCLTRVLVDTAYYAATRSELRRFWKRQQKLNSCSNNYGTATNVTAAAAAIRSTNRSGDGSLNRSRIGGSLAQGRDRSSTLKSERRGAGATGLDVADGYVGAGLVPVFEDIDSLALQKLPEKLSALLKLSGDDGSSPFRQMNMFNTPPSLPLPSTTTSTAMSPPCAVQPPSLPSTSPLPQTPSGYPCSSLARVAVCDDRASWAVTSQFHGATSYRRHYRISTTGESSHSSSPSSSFLPPLQPQGLSATSSSSSGVGQEKAWRRNIGCSITKHRIVIVEPVVLEVSPPALIPCSPRLATAVAAIGIEGRQGAIGGMRCVVNVFVKNAHPTRTVLLRSLDFHLDRTVVPKLLAMLRLRVGGQQPHDSACAYGALQGDTTKSDEDGESIAETGDSSGGVECGAFSSFLVGTSYVAKSDLSSVPSSSSSSISSRSGGQSDQRDRNDEKDRLLLERLFDQTDTSDIFHCQWLQDGTDEGISSTEEAEDDLGTRGVHLFAGTPTPRLLQPLSLSPDDALGLILVLEMSGVDALLPAHIRRLQHVAQYQKQQCVGTETHTKYHAANSRTSEQIGSTWRSGNDKPPRRALCEVAVSSTGPLACPLPSSSDRVLLQYHKGAWCWAEEQVPNGGGGSSLALTTPLTVSYTLGQITSTCNLSGSECACGDGSRKSITATDNGHDEGVKITISSAVNEAGTQARMAVGASDAMRHAVLPMEWCLPYRSRSLGPTPQPRTWLEQEDTTNHLFVGASGCVPPSSSSSSSSSTSSTSSSTVCKGIGRELLVQLSLCGGGGGVSGGGSRWESKSHKGTYGRTIDVKAVDIAKERRQGTLAGAAEGPCESEREKGDDEKGWHLWAGGDLRHWSAASATTAVRDYFPSVAGASRFVVEGEVFWVCMRVANLGRTGDPSPPTPLDLVVLADHSYGSGGMEASDALVVVEGADVAAAGGKEDIKATLIQPSPQLRWHSMEDDYEANVLFPNAARKKMGEGDENDEVELGPFNCCEGDAALAEWLQQTRNDSCATRGGGGGGGGGDHIDSSASADCTLRVNPVAITTSQGICVVAIDREKHLWKSSAGILSSCGYTATGYVAGGVWTGSVLLRYMPINCRGLVRLGPISLFDRTSREYFNVGVTLQVVVVERNSHPS